MIFVLTSTKNETAYLLIVGLPSLKGPPSHKNRNLPQTRSRQSRRLRRRPSFLHRKDQNFHVLIHPTPSHCWIHCVTNWHFSCSFHFIFLTLTILIFQDLIISTPLRSFKPFHLLTLFTDNEKTCVLNP